MHLEARLPDAPARRLRGHRETIAERFERDRAALLPLPAAPYEACEKITARVDLAYRWCAIDPTTTPCRPSTDTGRCW